MLFVLFIYLVTNTVLSAGDTSGLVSKLNGKRALNSQLRELVSKVMDFMKAEADAGNFVIDCTVRKSVRECKLQMGCQKTRKLE